MIPDTPALPFTDADAKSWKDRIGKAKQLRKSYESWWDASLKAYSPQVSESPDNYGLEIRTNRTYTLVERKSAELFYQKPDVQVSPSPLLDALPEGASIAQIHHDILNEKLGLDGVNVKAVARRAIFDYLLFGAGWTLVGYQAYTQDVPQADPMTGEVVVQPVPIASECFIENLSPRQVLVPSELKTTDMDKAPWLGRQLEYSLKEAKRLYPLPDDFHGSGRDKESAFQHGPNGDPPTDLVTGVQIFYRSSLFRDDVIHPDHLTELVLIDGLPDPVVHRDCPYQAFDRQGRLAPDALKGFPIQSLAIRSLTDSAFLMSDVAVALPLTKELDKFRRQMIIQRDVNLLKFYFNTDTMGKDDVDKLTSAPQGGLIGLGPEAFTQGDPIKQFPHGTYPRENFEYNNYIDDDLARTHGLDASSAGTNDTSGTTATEASISNANRNVRQGWEQSFVADWFLQLVTKYSTLLQKFLSVEDAAAIVGQEKAATWDQWRRMSPTRLSFTMAPDSSLRNDTPLERKQLQEVFTYLANDPTLNRPYLVGKLLQKFHLDPTQALLPAEQVPQPKPQPPALSLSFKGEDLNPMMPQSPIVLDLLAKQGVEIDPAAIQNAMLLGQMAMAQQQAESEAKEAAKQKDQPPHGGKAVPVESLDKHAATETGGMQGSGDMTPMMGGGLA
jgi:hypothetical protein